MIRDNFFRVNFFTSKHHHLFCSVLTVFLSIFIDNDLVPKVNCGESIACKKLISSEKISLQICKSLIGVLMIVQTFSVLF